MKHHKIKTFAEINSIRAHFTECSLVGFHTPFAFVNGCFDLFHAGHASLLNSAKSLSGTNSKLVVGINSDSSIKRLKGASRPIVSAVERAYIVACHEDVDYVFIFNDNGVSKYLKQLQPNFWYKGDEYSLDNLDKKEKRAMGECILRPLPLTCGQSSSKIIDKCRKQYL